jgi:hypothetical protein
MESGGDVPGTREVDLNEEELRKKIRDKCTACQKGDVCMIDHDHRVKCNGPGKK